MEFSIWYSDGTVLSSRTSLDKVGTWRDAPSSGVLGVVTRYGADEYGRPLGGVFTGSDWYGLDLESRVYGGISNEVPGVWISCDLPDAVPVDMRKRGIWVDNAAFARRYARMMAEASP